MPTPLRTPRGFEKHWKALRSVKPKPTIADLEQILEKPADGTRTELVPSGEIAVEGTDKAWHEKTWNAALTEVEKVHIIHCAYQSCREQRKRFRCEELARIRTLRTDG